MKKYTNDIIPLLISMILIVYSIGASIFTTNQLSFKHYLGFSLFIISLLFYYKNKKLFIIFFGSTLLLGVLKIIDFYYISIWIKVSIFEFNPIFIILLVLLLFLTRKQIEEYFPEKTKNNIKLNEDQVHIFKTRFKDKTDIELKEMIKENSKYTDFAKKAAKLILEDRENQNTISS